MHLSHVKANLPPPWIRDTWRESRVVPQSWVDRTRAAHYQVSSPRFLLWGLVVVWGLGLMVLICKSKHGLSKVNSGEASFV